MKNIDLLKPLHTYNLIRIGKENDGGYLIEKNSFENSCFLIGLGINDDWSFEEKFGKPFLGVDNKLDLRFLFSGFYKRLIILFFTFYKKWILIDFFNYTKKIIFYYNNKNKFLKGWVGGPYKQSNNYTLKDIVSLTPKINLFLKVDIEGGEYRILNEIIELEDMFTGYVIEFHDCDFNFDIIHDFILKSKSTLCHFHINNYGDSFNGIPTLIELTFAKSPKILNEYPTLPHPLDQPNSPF
jgi:hypothetical protein